MDTQNRVAVLAIIVQDGAPVDQLNDLLHEHAGYVISRMGVPYRQRKVNIMCVAMDAPADVVSALSGKIGQLEGVSAKTVYAPGEALSE